MLLRFSKYHGIGNDFVIVDETEPDCARIDAAQAEAICDRHLGIGADGVILVGDAPSMRIFNADGSRAQMCGNGLRCVALHLFRAGRISSAEQLVQTDAGPHRVRIEVRGGLASAQVWMSPPRIEPESLPLLAEGPWIAEPVEVLGRRLEITAISMGNPHAIVFDVPPEERLRLAPAIGSMALFPEGVNVGFASVHGSGLELHVFERGAGWTQACGTGACAAALAAVLTGRAPACQPLAVILPGGTLTIVPDAPLAPIRMEGPAAHVFDGSIELPLRGLGG
ncbi:MAG: diaminopimelate epimerase [Myxococcales bacterium]|nr:diaminopimelate epimerase [Myxococcales bacterium]